jgi:hypothetical protein
LLSSIPKRRDHKRHDQKSRADEVGGASAYRLRELERVGVQDQTASSRVNELDEAGLLRATGPPKTRLPDPTTNEVFAKGHPRFSAAVSSIA